MAEVGSAVGKFLFQRALAALSQKMQDDCVDRRIKELITNDLDKISQSIDRLIQEALFSSIDHMKIGLDLFINDKRKEAASSFEESMKKAIEAMNKVKDVDHFLKATQTYCLSAVYKDTCSVQHGGNLDTAMIECVNRLENMFRHAAVSQPFKVVYGVGLMNKARNLIMKKERQKLLNEVYRISTSLALFFRGRGYKEWSYIKLSTDVEIHTIVSLQKVPKASRNDQSKKSVNSQNGNKEDSPYYYRNTSPNNHEYIKRDGGKKWISLALDSYEEPTPSWGHLITFKTEQAPHPGSPRPPAFVAAQVRSEHNLQKVMANLIFTDRYEGATQPLCLDPKCASNGKLVCIGTWMGHLSLWDISSERCIWDVDLKRIAPKNYQVRDLWFDDDQQHIVLVLNAKGADKMFKICFGAYEELQESEA